MEGADRASGDVGVIQGKTLDLVNPTRRFFKKKHEVLDMIIRFAPIVTLVVLVGCMCYLVVKLNRCERIANCHVSAIRNLSRRIVAIESDINSIEHDVNTIESEVRDIDAIILAFDNLAANLDQELDSINEKLNSIEGAVEEKARNNTPQPIRYW